MKIIEPPTPRALIVGLTLVFAVVAVLLVMGAVS